MTAETAVSPRPPFRAWTALIGAEARSVVRDTAGLLVPLGMPLLILVMNGVTDRGEGRIHGVPIFEIYVMPLVLTIVVATIGVINMPSFLASYRRHKILRRLAVTPAHPGMILVAQVVVSIVQTLLGVAVGLTVAMLAFDVGPPERPWTALGVFALAAFAMYAVGMLVAAVAPTANAAVAIGLTLFFALGATGGMFGPTDAMPAPLAAVGEALPFGAAVQAIGGAWAGFEQEPAHLIAMAAAIVVSGAVAVKWFRWD
jgi:ABC-2 type transport system permease protein